uniref:Secreted RxLR effector protein 69 n=1 Tax=Plasmopara viticola TaxID=143451 RepID=RLR69_PLAVT|nr:RecName: Full=Secreted RxLR effector protein 69; Flags: Precursor [Plasmopara viticola]
MHSSTILFVLGAAILAVNGVTTALIDDEVDKGTQEKHRLLRSNLMKHETGEERFELPAWFIGSKAYKQRKRERYEQAKRYYYTLVQDKNHDETFRELDTKRKTLKSALKFIAWNYKGFSNYTKRRIRKKYTAYRIKNPRPW